MSCIRPRDSIRLQTCAFSVIEPIDGLKISLYPFVSGLFANPQISDKWEHGPLQISTSNIASGQSRVGIQHLENGNLEPKKMGRRPGLDGLRGLAWLSVFVGHIQPFSSIVPADTGMFIFFGLSGFLITQLLVEEQVFRGSICLGEFFKRRLVRLLPALMLFLAFWLLVVWIFLGSAWLTTVPEGGPSRSLTLPVALQGVAASLSYFMNWAEIFKVFNGYVPIGHIWSLAVEMQFYLAWAFILVFLIRRSQKVALWFAVLGSFAASIEAIWLMHIGDSGLRIYMGTDVRAGSLLAGAAAAMIWSRTRADFRNSKVLKISAMISALEILWSIQAFADPTFSISQQLAWPLTSIACAIVVVYMVELPHSKWGRWALHPVMQYIGKRSYGLYLWHYVWLTWFRSLGFLGVLMALGMSLISAEMSWRVVEKPVSDWFRRKRAAKKTQVAPGRTYIAFDMAGSGGSQ